MTNTTKYEDLDVKQFLSDKSRRRVRRMLRLAEARLHHVCGYSYEQQRWVDNYYNMGLEQTLLESYVDHAKTVLVHKESEHKPWRVTQYGRSSELGNALAEALGGKPTSNVAKLGHSDYRWRWLARWSAKINSGESAGLGLMTYTCELTDLRESGSVDS